MEVHTCSRRAVLEPCVLEGHAYQLDPYIGCEHHCYYCYALNQAETDWEEEILIHHDIVGQLSQEISSLEPQSIYIGWNSDAYQPSEKTFRQTRQSMELLAQNGFSVSILTKSDLVTRDIDLFASMQGSPIGISIAFQDEDVRQLFEANAPPNERRIEALKRLHEAGIETYVLICPVMPFITDVKSLIEITAPYADAIWIYSLKMESRGDRSWQNVEGILRRHFPEMAEKYRESAFSADHPYWVGLREELEGLQQEKGLNLRIEL